MRNLVLAACVAVFCVATGAPALAQSGTVQIDVRAEVAAALYAASATQRLQSARRMRVYARRKPR